MARFRKKPVEIEAIQFVNGNRDEVIAFIADGSGAAMSKPDSVAIETLEGVMKASPGDWIIRGIQGEFYPCKPDIFSATYDKVDN